MDAKGEINSNYFLWDSMCFPYGNISNTNDLKLYINTIENCATGATMAFRNNLYFIKKPFPLIKYFIHDRWLSINLAENNSLGILDEKLIRYRIHPSQETGGRKDEIEKINISKKNANNDLQLQIQKAKITSDSIINIQNLQVKSNNLITDSLIRKSRNEIEYAKFQKELTEKLESEGIVKIVQEMAIDPTPAETTPNNLKNEAGVLYEKSI